MHREVHRPHGARGVRRRERFSTVLLRSYVSASYLAMAKDSGTSRQALLERLETREATRSQRKRNSMWRIGTLALLASGVFLVVVVLLQVQRESRPRRYMEKVQGATIFDEDRSGGVPRVYFRLQTLSMTFTMPLIHSKPVFEAPTSCYVYVRFGNRVVPIMFYDENDPTKQYPDVATFISALPDILPEELRAHAQGAVGRFSLPDNPVKGFCEVRIFSPLPGDLSTGN